MAHGRFWKIIANVFIISIQFFWLGIIFTFVILPMLIVLPIRRINIKIRMQRKMVKNGMPRKDARIVTRKYKSMLYNYGSVIGFIKLAIKRKGKKDNEVDEIEIAKSEKKTKIKLDSYSFSI